VLFVNVPIGIALVTLARLVLPRTERSSGHFDFAGAVTSTLGMAALVYGFVHAASDGWSNAETIGSFALGLLLVASFVAVEGRAEAPITPLRLFADRNRASAYASRLMLVAGTMGMFFFLTQFLRGVLGYSDLKTGFAFLPLTLFLFVSSQLSARVLVERFGQRTIMIAGVALSTVGMLWLTQLSETSSYLSLVGPLAVFGLGNGLAFVPLTTAAIDGVEPADAGAASGLVNVMQQVGGALGLAVLVTVFGTASKNTAASPRVGESAGHLATRSFVHGADTAFWTATVFMVVTLLLVIFAIKPSRRHKPLDADEILLEEALVEA
jgi:MFS family permease